MGERGGDGNGLADLTQARTGAGGDWGYRGDEGTLARKLAEAVRMPASADLSGADLRRSSFDACIFEGAKLAGALAHKQCAADGLTPLLSKSQVEEVRWVSDSGEEPPGG
jgi:uncharacterized protein YjbI with pentapeptide repeats